MLFSDKLKRAFELTTASIPVGYGFDSRGMHEQIKYKAEILNATMQINRDAVTRIWKAFIFKLLQGN